jgi:hypothetical protein
MRVNRLGIHVDRLGMRVSRLYMRVQWRKNMRCDRYGRMVSATCVRAWGSGAGKGMSGHASRAGIQHGQQAYSMGRGGLICMHQWAHGHESHACMSRRMGS